MAAVDYAALVDALETLFLTQLSGTHVSQEPDEPTAEQCPAVLIRLEGFTREPARLVGFQSTGSPYDETIRFSLACTAFSAESPGDAARQRDALVKSVLTAVATDPTLGGRLFSLQVLAGDADVLGESAGIFARMTLTVEGQTQA